MPVAGLTLGELLARRARERPDHTYLVFEDPAGAVSEWTYARFDRQVDAVAHGLLAAGVRAGDRIILQLPNCVEFAVTVFAAARLGAIFTPSNTANRISEVAHLLRVTGARTVLACPEYLEVVRGAVNEVGAATQTTVVLCRGGEKEVPGLVLYEDLVAQGEARADGELPNTVDALAPVEIMFSSGTTSLPKGVVATHTNLLSSGRRQAMSYRTGPDDRFLTALPMFHASAQSTTLFAAIVAGGATAVFIERYSARRFWEQVRAHRTTRLTLVAMLLRTICAQPPAETDRDHRLRTIGYATNLVEEAQPIFERRFGIRLTNAYGLSEALTEVSIGPYEGDRHWPSVGRATMDREVRIVGEDGQILGPGEIGEIQILGVRGETVMKEYFNNPEATARAFQDGWLRTSDMGHLDADGFLFFSDRDIDLIKVAGENVSATEVEAVLIGHPGIAGAAVIGVPDPVRDEAVKAFVVPAEGVGLTAAQVQEFCDPLLARFKIPTIVEIVTELPTNAVGKIEKKQLRSKSQ